MKFLTDIYRSAIANPMLAGILALIVLVLFLVHPIVGLIAFAGAGFILWVLNEFSDDNDDDYFVADDPKDGGFPQQPDTKNTKV